MGDQLLSDDLVSEEFTFDRWPSLLFFVLLVVWKSFFHVPIRTQLEVAPAGWGFSGVGASGRLDGYCRSCMIQARCIFIEEPKLMLTIVRMGNGGEVESRSGQLGVCQTTGCRWNPSWGQNHKLTPPIIFLGVILAMHQLAAPRENLILTKAATVMKSLSCSLLSPRVPTFTRVKSWNLLRLIVMARSLQGKPAGWPPRD